jgi:hypothetical protein
MRMAKTSRRWRTNRSGNPSIHDRVRPARRVLLQAGLAAAAVRRRWLGCAGAPGPASPARLGFKAVPADRGNRSPCPRATPPRRHRALGRAGGHRRPHAGLQARRQQQRRRAGAADGHAPRRHALLPLDGSARAACWRSTTSTPTTACCTPTGRRPGRREGAQGAGLARHVGDRGRAEGRPLAGGAALAHARRITPTRRSRCRRPGRRPPADEDRGRPRRPPGAGHHRQLRRRQDALGHLPVGRRELRRLLHRGRRPHGRRARWGMQGQGWYRWPEHDEPLRHAAHTQRAQPLRLDRRGRPDGPGQHAGQAHGAGPGAHEGAWVGGDARRPRGGVLGRGRALRVHLQVRQPRPHRAGRQRQDGGAGQRRAAGPRHAVRGEASTPTAAALAAAGARPGPADGGQRLRRPGRGADQDPPGQPTCSAPPRWTAPSG